MTYYLRNSVIRSPSGKVKYRQLHSGGRRHYHIGVWVEADDDRELDRVESVEYVLHTSFRKPVRTSANRSNDFSITFWSWGTFVIHARLHLVGGGTVEVSLPLDYELPADPDLYEQVS